MPANPRPPVQKHQDIHFAPGTRLTLGSGQTCTVRSCIDQGGEGFILELDGKPQVVLKQYKTKNPAKSGYDGERKLAELGRKLAAMIASPPRSWKEPKSGHVRLAWPQDTAFDGKGFVGFVMPRIDRDAFVPIHIVTNPTSRAEVRKGRPQWVRGFTWPYRLQAAANLAVATQALHDGHVVIGDFNEQNILVTGSTRVSLVDCDSMQFPDPSGGFFLCEVGDPRFTAPEVRRGQPLLASADLFALAVHLHLLLLEGEHPFGGVWKGSGDPPTAIEKAAKGHYVYGPGRELAPYKGAVGFALMPKGTQKLFLRAFIDGAKDPEARPTADEWLAELSNLTQNLKTCSTDVLHAYPKHHRTCPWCKRQPQSGSTNSARSPASGANRQTNSAPAPSGTRRPNATRPVVTPPSPKPSAPTPPPSKTAPSSPKQTWNWSRPKVSRPPSTSKQPPAKPASPTPRPAWNWSPPNASHQPKASPLTVPAGWTAAAAGTAAAGTSPKRNGARGGRRRALWALLTVVGVVIGVYALSRPHGPSARQLAARHAAYQRAVAKREAAALVAARAAAARKLAAATETMSQRLNADVEHALPVNWPTRCTVAFVKSTDTNVWSCGVKQDPAMYTFFANGTETSVTTTTGPSGTFVVLEGPFSKLNGQSWWGLAQTPSETYWFDAPGSCATDAELEYQRNAAAQSYYYLYRKADGLFLGGVKGKVSTGDVYCLYLQTGQTHGGFDTHAAASPPPPVGHVLATAAGSRVVP